MLTAEPPPARMPAPMTRIVGGTRKGLSVPGALARVLSVLETIAQERRRSTLHNDVVFEKCNGGKILSLHVV